MQGLDGVIRNYAWGSQVDIARLQGREHPAELPEAEEWFGAHPSAPSILDDGRPWTAPSPPGRPGSSAIACSTGSGRAFRSC
ncbi:hypothetical protein GCM10029992_02190 [Glycomyces albus]